MVWINPGAGRGKSPLVIGGLIRHLSFVFFSKANYSKYKVGESEIAVQRPLFVPFPHFLKGQLIHFKCKNVCVTYGIVIIGRGQNNDPQKAECLSLWTKKLPDVTENSKRSKTYYINLLFIKSFLYARYWPKYLCVLLCFIFTSTLQVRYCSHPLQMRKWMPWKVYALPTYVASMEESQQSNPA